MSPPSGSGCGLGPEDVEPLRERVFDGAVGRVAPLAGEAFSTMML